MNWLLRLRNCLHYEEMNDLVFVMCNLKFNDNQVNKPVDNFDEVPDDLLFDDVKEPSQPNSLSC